MFQDFQPYLLRPRLNGHVGVNIHSEDSTVVQFSGEINDQMDHGCIFVNVQLISILQDVLDDF